MKFHIVSLGGSLAAIMACAVIMTMSGAGKTSPADVVLSEPAVALSGSMTVDSSGLTSPAGADDVGENRSVPIPAEVLPKWRELHQQNNHMVGWLKLEGTIVDYPVVQYLESEFDGNSFYLKHDFNKKPSTAGALFADWHTPITGLRRPDNTVIYGHNMFSTGTKFSHLVNYYAPRYGLDAYLDNPVIEFSTVYDDERSTYKIFAGMYVNTLAEHGYVFNYFQRRYFAAKDDFYDFVYNVMDRSVFYTEVDVEYGDQFLTLSTCYWPLGNQSDRFVLLARRVREGEEPTVDASAAYINPDPLYFDHYYKVKGGSWGGRNWDKDLVR